MYKGLFQRLLPHLIAIAVFLIVAVVYGLPAIQGKVLKQPDVVQWNAMAKNSFDYKATHGHFPLWTNSMFSGMPAYQISVYWPSGIHSPLRDPDAARKVSAYIAALGGKSNIVRVDACAETRLRVVVRDESQVRESALRTEGIAAVVRLDGQTFHLLADLNADQYAAEMRGQLATGSNGRAVGEQTAA